jgi:ligand-binding sensor domain-containing protein
MWFATNKGLFKFDGINYWDFTDKLPDENVTALAEDSLGNIWVGFRNGKIGSLEKNTFKPFSPEEGLSPMQVSDILFDEGVLWFSTLGDGIYYYVNDRLYRLDDIDGMPDLYAYDLEKDKQGKIWTGTDGGVAICSRNGNAVEIEVINYSNGLPDNIVRKISKGKVNEMLLATEDAGVISYDRVTNTVASLLKAKWNYGSVLDFLLINDWIWVATAHGLALIDLDDKTPSVKMLSSDHVTSLCADTEEGIWAGSKTDVKHTIGKHLEFYEPEGDKNIVAVAVGADGDIWFSTSRGLFRGKKGNGKLETTFPLKGTSFEHKKIISLYADEDGSIWAGFYGEGAIRINPQNGNIRNFSKELLNGNVVNISGRNRTIWLATLGGASEIKLDKGLAVKNYRQADGLSTDYLYQVYTDSQNRIWFATDRDGVDMLDENGFHHFKENLATKVVYGFAEDTFHQLWANVQNEGLFIFDGKKFNPFVGQNLLHGANFNGFSSGWNGQLFAIHNSGIDIFDASKKKFYYVSHMGTNLLPKIPNLNAVAKDAYGSVIIGTNSGLLLLSDFNYERLSSPAPRINQFEVNGQIFDLHKSEQLRYDENYIKVGFTGLWYQNPTGLSFSYKLENFDHDWITTDNRSATYSMLPPGEYTFKLRVSDSKDFSNSTDTSIHFVVNAPFWKTPWFIVLTTLVLVFLSYVIIRFREKTLLEEKHKLEERVKERTYEIQHKSNEIRLQAEQIKSINENLESIVKDRTVELEGKNKALEEYAFINAHKLRAPLARILGLTNLMKNLEASDEERIYLQHLQVSSQELDAVVRSITEAIERGDVKAEVHS